MWSGRKSLLLSKVCVVLVGLALSAVLIFSPWVVSYIRAFMREPEAYSPVLFYLTFFVGGAVCYFLLYTLYRLLHNIGRGKVFERGNIAYMRRISWACFLGGGIAFLSGFYWMPWFVVAAAAGFVGLVVRVVKNVVEQALALKEENDFTI